MPVSKQAALETRSKLKLRQRSDSEWEVYTTIHGTGVFKWFLIDWSTKEWYVNRFNPPVVAYHESEK